LRDGRAAPLPSSRYWDEVAGAVIEGRPIDAWRGYMRTVYTRLLDVHVPDSARLRGLKTDLFEEAVSRFNLMSGMSPNSIGIDGSPRVARAASDRLGRDHLLVVGDLRSLPLASGSIDFILSGSSLDHFARPQDLAISLAELARVLRDGGTLVLTLDNPQNPVVWLRNMLPFAWINRIGLVPYFVGATLGRDGAARALEALGLEVTAAKAVVHAPRLLAIWLVVVAEWLGLSRLAPVLAATFLRFERLEKLPTRFRTGYYVALCAVKRPATEPGRFRTLPGRPDL
jgi:SAM-dependent methyltransferase